ncbi:alpha/beta fold hydrolase [Saccharopolyspora sp. NPDC050389]|uniref:alpha/beta hydrolase n=1 Tax=Saccharopolyspora sp. NPDC050389 TaxID=3155516 RepID=UPI00340F50CA
MKTKIASLLGAVAVLGGVVAGSASAQPPPATGDSVAWRDCLDGLQCGEIAVPADWSQPGGAQIEIGLGKLPARDQATKLGTLVVNPGGPNPVLFALPTVQRQFDELTNWFDVVLFDPRGMGESSGVTCPEPMPFAAELPPPDREAYGEYALANRRFAEACAPALGPLRGNLNSWEVAHDLDAIRVALGESKLNYFGNSYGTMYGQAYAELFGGHVGRMYLDSVGEHISRELYDWVAPKAATLENNLQRFADWCQAESSCALAGRDVLSTWDNLLAEAAREPIPAPGAGPDVVVGAERIVASTGEKVRREDNWPALATALAAADSGDATAFAPPSALPPQPDVPGAALMGITTCADLAYRTGHDDMKRIETRLRAEVAPRLGWGMLWTTVGRCAGLPRTGLFPPHPLRPAPGLPPVLIANGSNDGGAPPEHGRLLAAQLPGARYLPADGNHALYLGGNRCVRDHVHRYLTAGELPPPDAHCSAA